MFFLAKRNRNESIVKNFFVKGSAVCSDLLGRADRSQGRNINIPDGDSWKLCKTIYICIHTHTHDLFWSMTLSALLPNNIERWVGVDTECNSRVLMLVFALGWKESALTCETVAEMVTLHSRSCVNHADWGAALIISVSRAGPAMRWRPDATTLLYVLRGGFILAQRLSILQNNNSAVKIRTHLEYVRHNTEQMIKHGHEDEFKQQ